MSLNLDELKARLRDPEVMARIKEDMARKSQQDKIEETQIERAHNKFSKDPNLFGEFVEKVLAKHDSKGYNDRWYNRGIMPPERLNWFLYRLAKTHGREATEDEYMKWHNMFTDEIHIYDAYAFMQMNGQGSVIRIWKL